MPLLLSAFVTPAASTGSCEVSSLRLSVAQGEGDRARIVVSVTNEGRTSCDLGSIPEVYFTGPDGTKLPLAERNPFRSPNGISLGVGPVVLPLRIAPSGVAVATTTLAATAEQPGVQCVDRASINLRWQSTLSAPVPFRICFDATGPSYFGQLRLQSRPELEK